MNFNVDTICAEQIRSLLLIREEFKSQVNWNSLKRYNVGV